MLEDVALLVDLGLAMARSQGMMVGSGESGAKPNRRTSQQRTTRAPEPHRPGTRGLWFGSERGPRQNPAKPREFLGLPSVAAAKSLQPQTSWRSEWSSNFQYPLRGRIGSESGPPNSATEMNATSRPRSARNPPSPGPIRPCPSPKTPRKRESFWHGRGVRAQSLCNRRLVGGANGIRTSGTPCGANRKRIGTARFGNRDKPAAVGAARPSARRNCLGLRVQAWFWRRTAGGVGGAPVLSPACRC